MCARVCTCMHVCARMYVCICVCVCVCSCVRVCVEGATVTKGIPGVEISVKAGSHEVLWLYVDSAHALHGWQMRCVGNMAGHGARETGREQSGLVCGWAR